MTAGTAELEPEGQDASVVIEETPQEVESPPELVTLTFDICGICRRVIVPDERPGVVDGWVHWNPAHDIPGSVTFHFAEVEVR